LRNILALLVVLVAVAAVEAQSSRLKVIVWSGDKNCGRSLEGVSCESLETPRGIVSVVNDQPNAVSLAVSFFEDGDYIIAATHLKNISNEPLMFDSDFWGAAHFDKKENARVGRKPIVAELAIPSRDIARGIRSGAAVDNSVDSFMASIARSGEVREVRQPDGTRQRKLVIVPDQQAVRDASLRSDSRQAKAESEQERIRKNALTQKSVPANSSAKGLVYFRRVKKAEIVVFSFRVADSIYVFRLLRKA
jgi:hypothetical protein